MGRIEKTVFISYRRANYPWALAIYQDLQRDGYDVFLDNRSINSGDFETIIVENIRSRAHFLVILTPSALERCTEPGDWLRREIECAMQEKRNIVPVLLDGFDFNSAAMTGALSGPLAELRAYNGLTVPMDYFDAAMDKLRKRFLNVPLDMVLHPASSATQQATLKQKAAASGARPVTEDQLTAQTWLERGHEAYSEQHLDVARGCYQEAIRLDPRFAAAYAGVGSAFFAEDRYAESATAYRKAIELDPSLADAYSGLGTSLSMQGELAEAEAAYRRAIELDPSDSVTFELLSTVLTEMGREDEAEAAWDKGLELNTLDTDPDDLPNGDQARAYFTQGNTLYTQRRYGEAEAAYRKVLELDPACAAAYRNLSNALYKQERYDESLEASSRSIELICRKTIEMDPTSADGYEGLGEELMKQGRYAEAEEAYRKATQLDPSNAQSQSHLGDVLGTQQRYKEAEAAYRKAIQLGSTEVQDYYNLGNTLMDQQRDREAETAFRKTIQVDPSYAPAHNNLGNALMNQKREKEGEAAYRKALELDPSMEAAYHNLARHLQQANRLQEAQAVLAKMREACPDSLDAYQRSACVSRQLGRPIPAAWLESARQLIPEDGWYDLACVESLGGNTNLAFEHLAKAARQEGFDPAWAWQDTDLQWIRHDPRFTKIVGRKP